MVAKKVLLAMLLIGVFMLDIQAQTTKDDIQLVVSGDGITKEDATKIALRSAIEQAFGTFVSANTEMLNDEIIKDEIATVSSGNIKSFEYIAENALDGKHFVTIKATVSIGRLVEYTKSKGAVAELAGATFAMNMKMRELNKKNELTALQNLQNELTAMMPYIFDYEIKIKNPIALNNSYQCSTQIIVKTNKSTKEFYDIFHNTLSSLSLSESECIEYASTNTPINCIYFPNIEKVSLSNNTSANKEISSSYFLRNGRILIEEYLQDLQSCIINGILNFQIIDGIGKYWLKNVKLKSGEYGQEVFLKANQAERFSLPEPFTYSSDKPFIIFDKRSPKLKPEIRVIALDLETVSKWEEMNKKIIEIKKKDSLEHLRNEEQRDAKKRTEEYQKKALERNKKRRTAINQMSMRELRVTASEPDEKQSYPRSREGVTYTRTRTDTSIRERKEELPKKRDTRIDISSYKINKIYGCFYYYDDFPIFYGEYSNGELLHSINLKINYTLDELQKITEIRIEPLANNLKK